VHLKYHRVLLHPRRLTDFHFPTMMSILGRMNPAVCLGGGSTNTIYAVDDDVVDMAAASDHSTQAESSNSGTKNSSGNSVHGAKSRKNAVSSFNSCMGPAHCSSRYHPDDTVEPLHPADVVLHSLGRTVPDLLGCISSSQPTEFPHGTSPFEMRKAIREFNTKRTEALQKLHDLTTKGMEYNRVPLVTKTGHGDVIGVLSAALLASTSTGDDEDSAKTTIDGTPRTKQQQSKAEKSAGDDRRLICWTINNLSIAYENKEAIVLGEHSATLLQALTEVIKSNLPETYLCCICLLNLTFLADAIRPVTFYMPSSYGNGKPPYSSPLRSRSAIVPASNSSSLTINQHSWSRGKPPTSPLSRSRSAQVNHPARTRSSPSNGKNLWMSEQHEGGRISEICGLVLGNSSSLLRIVERMMLTNAPFLTSTVQSAQGEAVRWACGFIRNVTYAGEPPAENNNGGGKKRRGGGNNGSNTDGSILSGSTGRHGIISNESIEEVCILVSATEIPRLMVQFVGDSPNKTLKWTKDSLEDICMGAMCNMAQSQSSREALKRAGAVKCLEKIEGVPGIHGYRARAIRCSLGALPLQFG